MNDKSCHTGSIPVRWLRCGHFIRWVRVPYLEIGSGEQTTILKGDTKVNEQEILENMVKIADELNFGLDTNAIKIAKLKSRMDDWKRCPCDKQNPDRFCGSKLCQEDTIRDGWCHCHSYFRIDKQYNTK